MDMVRTDTYLSDIQEVTDPITITLGFGTAMIIANLIVLAMSSASVIGQVKVDKKLSDRLNKILNSGNKWIVHIFPTKDPNAFSLGFGKHIFVTTELLNILNADEVDSILLHEVYHSSKKHTYKQLAYKYPLFYLIAFIGSTFAVTGSPIFFSLGLLAMFITNKIGDIVYDISVSRRMEFNADSYATKYGYGKQLISSFDKLKKWAINNSKNQHCDKWCKIINKLDRAIDKHPAKQKRVENILKQTKKMDEAMKSKQFGKIKEFVMKAWGK